MSRHLMRVEKRLDLIGRSRPMPILVGMPQCDLLGFSGLQFLLRNNTVRPAAKAATRTNIGAGYQW
jgi:hypothetical protein